MCNSNKGTGGMESSVVLFKPRINLFACTRPSVSNSLDFQTRLVCGSLFVNRHRSTTMCVKTV